MNPRDVVRKFTLEKQVMQFVTVKDGKPWICSVHYVPDEDGNLYWLSNRSTRHSQELKANKTTAAAILVDPDKKQCIHMEGEAFEVTGDEINKVHEIYGARYGQKADRLDEVLSNDPNKRAYYVFRPTYTVLFDYVNFHDSPRQEFK